METKLYSQRNLAKSINKKTEDFVWRMCVSYCGLNIVSRPVEYTISQFYYAISIFSMGASVIYIITVDAKQDYHQVTVHKLHVQFNFQI